jgi:hypothetical protein
MTLFSQRKGLKPLAKSLQVDGMDADLRNSLWTALQLTYFHDYRPRMYGHYENQVSEDVDNLIPKYWMYFFKFPIDNQPNTEVAIQRIRDSFFKFGWHEVYDFVEFTLKNGGEAQEDVFRKMCNHFLQTENSGYRFVGNELTPITSPSEMQAVEEAMGSGLRGVETHLTSAVVFLSDRKNPNYRNSIKESISAVESICCLMAGQKSTLGSALKVVADKAAIHPALEKAFSALYGYTSDEKGIRHALLEQQADLTFTDAKFMLVACSGFVNYLVGKAADLRIKLR